MRFRRFLRSLRRVVWALDFEFAELEVAGEEVERPFGVFSASSTGSGVVIPTCLSLLQVITSLQPSTESMVS